MVFGYTDFRAVFLNKLCFPLLNVGDVSLFCSILLLHMRKAEVETTVNILPTLN